MVSLKLQKRYVSGPWGCSHFNRSVAFVPFRWLNLLSISFHLDSLLPSLSVVSARSGWIPTKLLKLLWLTLVRMSANWLRTVSSSASLRPFTPALVSSAERRPRTEATTLVFACPRSADRVGFGKRRGTRNARIPSKLFGWEESESFVDFLESTVLPVRSISTCIFCFSSLVWSLPLCSYAHFYKLSKGNRYRTKRILMENIHHAKVHFCSNLFLCH